MVTNDRSLSILIHGPSKVGKSTLAVTAPAPRLLMDVEAASRFLPIKSVKWNPAKEKPPVADGTWDTCVVSTRDWDTVSKALQWLESGMHPFKSFIIDSISALQGRYVEKIAGRTQPTMNQWGDAFRTVGGLVQDIRDLTDHPTHPIECVVLTAMSKHTNGMFRPWCQGQLQDTLPYLMDSIGYLQVDSLVNNLTGEITEIRKLSTRSNLKSDFEAGERVGGAWPATMEKPNISTMIDMIFGEQTDNNNTEKSN